MFEVSTFYRFTPLDHLETLRDRLLAEGRRAGLRGTILLASEGINATIAGESASLRAFMDRLRREPVLADLPEKISRSPDLPFHRFKVRIKKEIVTLGVPGLEPARDTGTPVPPDQWNQLLEDPDLVLIDTRNHYETAIGRFANAVDPETESFRDFPKWVEEHLDPTKTPRVAMYCTGGIRCEKASAYLKQQGFEEVFQLQGGILKYLEEMQPEQSRWEGECFVFDGRVGVGHGVAPGNHQLCPGCRNPLTPADREDPRYEEGVVCPQCHDRSDARALRRRRERHRQMQLAAQRGETHLGREFPKPE